MPSFSEAPAPKVPSTPTGRAVNEADSNPPEGFVQHAQYNSPLPVYSDNAVSETFNAQTGGKVSVVPQRPGYALLSNNSLNFSGGIISLK